MDRLALKDETLAVAHTLPPKIRAGAPVRWSLELRPGRALPAGARFGLARNWPSDGGRPQWRDPRALNFIAATASNGARLDLSAGRRSEWHPYDHGIVLTLLDPLDADAVVTVGFGEAPSPGFEAQTFVEEECAMRIFLSETERGEWLRFGQATTRVVGAEAVRLVATAPSIVAPGEMFEVHVRAEDRWGNPASDADFEVGADGYAATARLSSDAGSVARLPLTIFEEGVHRLTLRDRDGRFAATSNPIRCALDAREKLFWGDIHAQSAIGCGAQRIETYFRFARDFAAVDFASHQGNCFLISNPEWDETREVTQRLNEDGRFVALLGYEWSGTTELGGDHNVYFPGDEGELRRCSHSHVADKSDLATDLPHVTDLHAHVRGTDRLLAVHVGGRTSSLQWHEPTTEKLLEIHSTHATSEWLFFEALRRGYRFGLTGGSDGVDGRPGASSPGRMSVRNLRGGLAAVPMTDLSRSELWSALRARRTYATTGERILLEVEADGHGLGAEYETDRPPCLAVSVEGTAALRSVEIFRGLECVFSAPIEPRDPTPSGVLRLAWRGASAPGNWERARMVWDGRLDIVGGSIGAARDYAADSAGEGIVERSASHLAWTSITAGNWNGVEFEVEEKPGTLLRFTSGPLSTEFALAELGAEPLERGLKDPKRALRLERLLRVPAGPSWSGSFTDLDAPEGEHPYWVRVRQDDAAAAWSSPIYARVKR